MNLRPLLIAFALLGALAAVASAADYNATLSASATKYEWDGGPGNSVIGDSSMDPAADCGPGHDCDNLLLKVDDAGALTVAIAGTSDGNVDTDLYLYESDASGKKGKELAAGESFSPDDTVATRAKAGAYYLVIMSYRTAVAATYHGTATLKPSAPAGAPVTGGGSGLDAAPTVALNKIAAKKVKKFTGTASDDKGVAGVEFALYKQAGKKCQLLLNAKGKFSKAGECGAAKWLKAKGTTKWSFSLKKALKKGKYSVAVRSTDSAGSKSAILYKKFSAR